MGPSASLLAVWVTLFAFGIAVVYHLGLRIERWSRDLGFACLVLLAPTVLIGTCIAAHRIVRVDQADCEEKAPSAARLSGMSPMEFRARCMATKDPGEWLTSLRSSSSPERPDIVDALIKRLSAPLAR
jgi:hypothetical protein